MKRRSKGNSVRLAAMAVAGLMSFGTFGTSIVASANTLEKGNLASNGKYYTDYATLAEAREAANKLNEEIAAEGDVLLKNDGTLPLSTSKYVSVFGRAEDNMVTGTGSISSSLMDAGFHVNGTLKNYYAGIGASIGNEDVGGFTKRVESSLSLYNDAAIVVLSRTGSEGNDPARVIGESNDDSGNVNGWEHANLASDEDGNEHKHYLQLTDSENELLDYVKDHGFKKIIVILNTSNVMEMYNLQNDDRINGILWIGRPGDSGVSAVGKILSGEVNPSGRSVDEWTRDFSADPTWMNFGNNVQLGSDVVEQAGSKGSKTWASNEVSNKFTYMGNSLSNINGVSYEEGIYIGYKYYETVWAEIKAGSVGVKDGKLVAKDAVGAETGDAAANAWWNDNVVYPYGFGMSYTSFDMEMGEIYTDAALKTALGTTVDADKFNSSEGHKATYDKLYVPVTVTNTGNVIGKQVAQVYVTAPYTAGGIEKSYVKLVGFAKTEELKPGATETVVVSFNVQDFASFDYNDANKNGAKTYELDAGNYEVKLMTDSHTVVEQKDFTLADTAVLAADDYSGNAVSATDFSNPNSEYYTLIGKDVKFSEAEPESGKNLYGDTSNMTIMSRANLATTAPDKHKESDYIATKELLDYLDRYCSDAKSFVRQDFNDDTSKWALTEAQKAEMADWTQASAADVAVRENGLTETLLRDMAGKPLRDADGNITDDWTAFMNQLSYAEIARLITQCSQSSPSIAAIGKIAARNIDGPTTTADVKWTDAPILAATWNAELCYKMGVMVGNLYTLAGYTSWYGPALNQHRSPFGGRNHEYYGQDAIQAGYLGSQAVAGCESRGVNCYVKHFALNDQETNRTNIATFADEQNIRENYLPTFQMAVQEGRASALMMTFSRIGVVAGPANYVLIQEIARDEWGFDGAVGTDFFPYNQSGFTVGTEGADDYYKFAGGRTTYIDLMIRTGGVHPLGNDNTLSTSWDEEKKTVVVTDTGVESKTDWYYARLFATRLAYVYANSVNIDNGVLFGQNYTMIYDYTDKTRQPQPETMTKTLDAGTVGVQYSKDLAATEFELGKGNVATYSVSEGTLPAGLTFDASTGVLSGTPTETGTFNFTVRATVANNYGEADITLAIEETIIFEGKTTYDVGGDVDIVVEPGEILGDLTYSATGLPAGVSIDRNTGSISGKATEAGVFEATVTIASTIGRNTSNYVRTLTVTVNGEEVVALTEARVQEIVNTAIAGIEIPEGLTEARVQEIITAALAADKTDNSTEEGSGCGAVIGIGTAILATVTVLGAAVVLHKKED